MCGISGFFNNNYLIKDPKKLLMDMTNSQFHRGPDKTNYWNNENIYFGHNRLSILDLSETGNQPMVSQNKRYIIVYNGEIYNHLKLRKKYLSEMTFKGSSDTETLLELATKYGIAKSLNLIEGMFAFAFYDMENDKIYLARDRVGEKPLYYHLSSNNFFFSSQLKAIRKLPFNFDLNKNSINLFLKYNYIPSPSSIFSNLNKLPPASYLEINFIKSEKRLTYSDPIKYWDFRKNYEKNNSNYKNITTSELKDHLSNSVAKQLISDVEVGCFLSGGIDSSLISLLMSENLSSSFKTFTIGFDDNDYDESQYARIVSRTINSEHIELTVTPGKIVETLENIPFCYDEPFADSSQIPTMMLSQLASNYVKVVLSGDGGDELFGGYNRYFLSERIWKKISFLYPSIRKKIGYLMKKIPPNFWKFLFLIIDQFISSEKKIKNVNYKIDKLINRLFYVKSINELFLSLVTISEPQTLLNDDLLINEKSYFEKLKEISSKSHNSKRTFMNFDFETYLPDDILVKVDRASMYYGLEVRCPFLDPNIISLSQDISNKDLFDKNGGKQILKKILSNHFNDSFINRNKTGFGIPIGKYINNDLKKWSDDFFNKKICEKFEIFDYDKIKIIREQHLAGIDHTDQLWQVVIMHGWAMNNL